MPWRHGDTGAERTAPHAPPNRTPNMATNGRSARVPETMYAGSERVYSGRRAERIGPQAKGVRNGTENHYH